jgi:hypothetical protein
VIIRGSGRVVTKSQRADPATRPSAELERYQPAEIGPGLVNRVGRQLLRQFMTPWLGPVPRSRR